MNRITVRTFCHTSIRIFLGIGIALSASDLWSQTLEPGEVAEYSVAPESTKADVAPPKRHLHRVAFLNIASLAAMQSRTIPLSLEYEYLGGTRTSLFIGVSHDFGAADDDLKTGVTLGQRWYFARDHAGPFLGIAPLFAIGPDQGPVLLAVLGTGGYMQRMWTSPWYLSGHADLGPGIYWYESPRYDPISGKSDTNRGVIVVNLGLALNFRF